MNGIVFSIIIKELNKDTDERTYFICQKKYKLIIKQISLSVNTIFVYIVCAPGLVIKDTCPVCKSIINSKGVQGKKRI